MLAGNTEDTAVLASGTTQYSSQSVDLRSGLSDHHQELRRCFEEVFEKCRKRGSICCCQLKVHIESGSMQMEPNPHNHHILERLLRNDDLARNPYLKWSKQDLATALTARRIPFPNEDNDVSAAYRHALEVADTERQFPFMELPEDVRMIVYGYALTYETVQTSRPSLLSVCRQIREEGSPTFFRVNDFRIHWEPSGSKDSLHPKIRRDTLQWLEMIGPSQVENLRHLLLQNKAPAQPYRVDLSCGDTSKWSVAVRGHDHSLPSCPRKEFQTRGAMLADMREHGAEWLLPVLTSLQTTEFIEWMEEAIQRTQKGKDLFADHCGHGKIVKPNIKGIEMVVRAFATMVDRSRFA
ncbi:hypothetical protein D6D01_09603 [Aureobasidium pullulans]|uniref:F-box domain-containing protein n=1 Tax=Aureobasidium pullulans TaxID=5580 RepID=A0A4S9K360_AURPU|nr:hypothetical protein D6D01_09603 [Aureobasidium pullulans]